MAASNTIDTIILKIDSTILSFVNGSFTSFVPAVETLWQAMFIIFIAFYGYKVMLNGRFSLHEGTIHCAKMLLIFVLITSWTDFQVFVMDIVTDTPSDIAGQVLNGTTDGTFNVNNANTALGEFYERSLDVSSKIMDDAGWNVTLILYSWAVWLAALILTAYALALIALSKIAVAIILSVAPFFILMLVFAQTKTLFEGWLRTLLNYAFIPIFVYTLLALLLLLLQKPLLEMENNISASSEIMAYIAPFMLICVVSIVLLLQVMNIASGIAGGLSLSTMGLGRYAAGKIGGAARTSGSYARYRGDQAADTAGRGIKNVASKGAEKLRAAIEKNRGGSGEPQS